MQYIVLFVMTFLGALASVFFKKASSKKTMLKAVSSYPLYLGCLLYLLAAILNIYALSLLNYSKVLPLTSITYIWTMLLSYWVFNEEIGMRKFLGVGFILLGSMMVCY